MMSFYNQNEYENCQPGSYYWLEEETLATARARRVNEEGNSYPYSYSYNSAQVGYPAVQSPQYNYGLGGHGRRLGEGYYTRDCCGRVIAVGVYKDEAYVEEWWDRLTNLVYHYVQSKCGLGGNVDNLNKSITPHTPKQIILVTTIKTMVGPKNW